MTGSLPEELSGLGKIRALQLRHNHLTGEIPAWLGGLTYLAELDLAHNRLSGEIPKELGRLGSLQRLFLSGNSLTGCVPSQLRGLDLSNLGLPFCNDSISRYDVDNNGAIEKDEVIVAVHDYFDGIINLEAVMAVVVLYFSK